MLVKECCRQLLESPQWDRNKTHPIVGGTITAGDITGDPDGIGSNPNYYLSMASSIK